MILLISSLNFTTVALLSISLGILMSASERPKAILSSLTPAVLPKALFKQWSEWNFAACRWNSVRLSFTSNLSSLIALTSSTQSSSSWNFSTALLVRLVALAAKRVDLAPLPALVKAKERLCPLQQGELKGSSGLDFLRRQLYQRIWH